MGLLKHVILPTYCLLHANLVFMLMIRKDIPGTVALFDFPAKEGESQEPTVWEQHLFGILAGEHLAFLSGNLVGIFHEHSHFRAIITAMELIHWAAGGYDASVHGVPCGFAYAMAAMAAVGLLVHSREPGLLTADNSKGKEKNK